MQCCHEYFADCGYESGIGIGDFLRRFGSLGTGDYNIAGDRDQLQLELHAHVCM